MASDRLDCLVGGLPFRQLGYARHAEVMKPDPNTRPLPGVLPCRAPSVCRSSGISGSLVPPREDIVSWLGIREPTGPLRKSLECSRIQGNHPARSKFVLRLAHGNGSGKK